MIRPIVVINPNSNQSVTDGLEKGLMPFHQIGAFPIECGTLTDGPFGIESQLDSDSVVIPLTNLVKRGLMQVHSLLLVILTRG